ncbi:MAG: 4'-phosphopantetheinyl transferase superfamily protein [Hyphomicrobiales bacterium]
MTEAARLWLVPAGGDLPAETLARLLTAGERQRLAGLADPTRRREFLLSRALVRALLGVRLGLPPNAVPIVATDRGKPVLAATSDAQRLSFSWSHAGGAVLVAIGGTRPVGVDLEPIGPAEPRIARRFFTAAERARLDGLAGKAADAGFFRVWTVKEAIAKARGLGISLPFRSIDVGPDDTGIAAGCRWWSVDAGPGHRAALAVLEPVDAPAAAPAPPAFITPADIEALAAPIAA